jgi:hypothetical protein
LSEVRGEPVDFPTTLQFDEGTPTAMNHTAFSFTSIRTMFILQHGLISIEILTRRSA